MDEHDEQDEQACITPSLLPRAATGMPSTARELPLRVGTSTGCMIIIEPHPVITAGKQANRTDLAAMREEARLLPIAILQRRHLITVPAPGNKCVIHNALNLPLILGLCMTHVNVLAGAGTVAARSRERSSRAHQR